MPNIRHTLGQIEGTGALFASAEIQETQVGAGGSYTLGDLSSPVATQNDFSLTDNGVGDLSLVISNFKGPVGVAFPIITLLSSGTFGERGVRIISSSYSGDTYTLRYRTFLTSTGVAADGTNAIVQVVAF